MTDAYLGQVLAEYAVDTGPYSSARQVQAQIAPIVKRWGGQFLMHIEPSGSFAKGTAVRTGTDIDLFISLSFVLQYNHSEVLYMLYHDMMIP